MLVSTEAGGLGNRIKSWVSVRRLDPSARVFWPRTENMPAAFDELFVDDCRVLHVPDGATEHASWRLAILPEDHAELPRGFATAGGGAHPLLRQIGRCWWKLSGQATDRYRYMIAPKKFPRQSAGRDGRVIDFEYARIPEYFRRVYVPRFAEVTARPEIRERVDAFAAEYLDEAVIGIQVRTWRDAPRRHRRHFRPAVSRLEAMLAAADRSRRFFVVSDNDEVVSWLTGLVGPDRILSFPRETARRQSWHSPHGMVEDLIDMLLLARTDEIFASYLSTFGETSWWLGGAKAKVTVF